MSPHPDEPDLLQGVRQALADPDPLSLLAMVSTQLCVLDPRRPNPFDPADQPPVSREELVTSYLGVPCRETSALLAVLAELAGDELMRARVRRELATRNEELPGWLAGLRTAEAYRAMEVTHVLGDGENVLLGVRLGTGHELTCLVYVDHNLGTLVKDAFLVSQPLAEVVVSLRNDVDASGDSDTVCRDIPLADARARITEAIRLAAMTVPPIETDTWPASRALIEWAVGLLPDGGRGYERPEWDEADLAKLTERFFASPYGSSLDDPDHRLLLESLLWFGTGYGNGDPLLWSPVRVEIVLTDWIPRKIVADAEYLSKVPKLLTAFIGFCHAERGIRAGLTEETVAAVDHYEGQYQQTIRSPQPQGPAALLAAMGLGGDLDEDDDSYMGNAGTMPNHLVREVGDEAALDGLDDEPLPDEPFAWAGIPDDIHERVREVLALTDQGCDRLLDREFRTSCRRLLARMAAGDPAVFRRKSRPAIAAATIVWLSCKANGVPSPGECLQMKDVMSHFGVQQSSVSNRARSLLKAGGFKAVQYGNIVLASPDYLVSDRRREIIQLRDFYR